MLCVTIDGQTYDRDTVLAWEDRRLAVVRGKLGLPRSTVPRAEQRLDVLNAKLALGHHGVRSLLARELWLSEKVTRLMVPLSGKRRRFSRCEIAVANGSAAAFAR